MEAIVKLQYSDYNDDEFITSDNYFNEGEYRKALEREFENVNEAVNNFVKNTNRGVSRDFLGIDGQLYQIEEKTSQNASKVAYTQCVCTLYKQNGEDEDVDGIVASIVSSEPTVLPLEFNQGTMDGEFEVELTSWLKERSSILSYGKSKGLGDDWVILNEPCRDVFLSFKNKNNDDVDVVLRSCKILGVLDNNGVVLYSNKHCFV